MKKILFSIILGIMVLGITIGNEMAQANPPDIKVRLALLKTDYLLNEDLLIAIILKNKDEADIITSEGFSDERFHLLLAFTGPDGEGIKAKEIGSDETEAGPPKVVPVIDENNVVQLLQVVPVEIVPGTLNPAGPFILTTTLPNAPAYYGLIKAGRYKVKAVIPIRTYLGTLEGNPGVAELASVDSEGVIESNTVDFSLSADADVDGYYYPEPNPLISGNTDPDCDDTDPNVNPGTPETPGNGIDDDCNPATLDVVVVESGFINIQVDRHIVGNGSHPGSTKEPIGGMEVRAYDKSAGSCVNENKIGGISWQTYKSIWFSCKEPDFPSSFVSGETDVSGNVSLSVPPGNYIVIGEYEPDDPNPIYIGVSAGGVESGTTTDKYLQVIEKADGKKVPAKYTRKTGSELLIIEPEYVEWDGTEELYPFVFDSLGDWSVTTSVSPPEGFVTDNNSLTEEVNTELEALQFTITDIGSDWVDTGVTHDLSHKGKKEKIKTRIGVKLSKKLAKKKGLNRFGKKKKK